MKPYLLQHFLEQSTEQHPHKVAVRHKKDDLTYAQLLHKAQGLGAYLRSIGIHKHDRVGIFIDKSLEQVIALFGILYADAVFVIINPALHEKQVKHIITDCQIKTIIIAEKQAPLLQGITAQLIHVEAFAHYYQTPVTQEPQCISDDMATIIYTSGSTGMPKGIVITHRNLMDGAKIVSSYLKITPDERILGLLPLNFDYGLNQLTSTLYKGCTIVLFQYFMPNALLQIIQEEKITGLAAIPTIWTSVFNSKLANLEKAYDHSSLRYITNSGGKIPMPIVTQIRQYFKTTDLYLMYGLTEAFRSTYLDPHEVDARPESMGKAIPNVEIEVINAEGQRCKPNEIGELIHRGACIARGYWNNPQKTSEVYKPNPLLPKENQFLETVVYSGDLVYKDADGFLYFVGRKDNMIKTGGYRVSPTEVEELLMQCAGIAEVVVFGVPDDALGYKIRAIVVPNKEITATDITNHCKTEAPAYLVPQEIYFKDSFPRTASGKIDRPKVIEESKQLHGY